MTKVNFNSIAIALVIAITSYLSKKTLENSERLARIEAILEIKFAKVK